MQYWITFHNIYWKIIYCTETTCLQARARCLRCVIFIQNFVNRMQPKTFFSSDFWMPPIHHHFCLLSFQLYSDLCQPRLCFESWTISKFGSVLNFCYKSLHFYSSFHCTRFKNQLPMHQKEISRRKHSTMFCRKTNVYKSLLQGVEFVIMV